MTSRRTGRETFSLMSKFRLPLSTANPILLDRLVAALLFLVTLVIFWFSPVRQVTDSQYSMFLSECLIHKQTFALDNCNVHVLKPMPLADYITNGGIYQLEIYRG